MRALQKPPPGMAFIGDVTLDDGTLVRGIASRLGLTPSTYRKWRMAGKGPDTFLLGSRVTARIQAIDAWISEQERAAREPSPEMRPPEARIGRARRQPAA